MSDISLSKAVRSNLLSLQNTAAQMSKTQERLATGNRVNSALDNPTNYFTASSLNSRASDLNQLLDSVSNAVQTIAAADKGISAITKLVESAQATARQALQTSATIDQTSGNSAATSGKVTAGAFSALNVSGAGGSADAGSVTAGAFSTVNLSGAGSSAEAGKVVGGSFSNVDFTNGGSNDGAITFSVAVNGGSAQSISIGYADVSGTASSGAAVTASELSSIINTKMNSALGTTGQNYASVNGSGGIDIASNTTGGSSSVAITGFSATNGATGSGLADGSDTGAAAVSADSISFSLAVDGGSPNSITLNAAAVTAYNSANSTSLNASALSANDVASLINAQAGSNVASVSNGALKFTSGTTGSSSSVAITGYSATTTSGSTGIANGNDSGAASTPADSVTFNVAIDGGANHAVTISAATVSAYNTAKGTSFNASSLTAANVAAMINDQVGSNVASTTSGGALQFASTTTGASSSVAITGYTASATSGSTGIANGSQSGQAANAGTTSTVANPKREELRTQYNDLLDQIDQLAKDSGFNGVNLLNGDNLSVLFNEDGSSKLDVTGANSNAAGLSLTKLNAGDFDTNDSINNTLNGLKGAIDDLRTQASKFGSNLSVVQTRQDFTKNMINVLQTGAANLTLADTNEEAANLLALQTRQQLSSTALSMASQSDQAVLRLF